MGYINQSFAIPDKAKERQKRYGRNYSSIDFEIVVDKMLEKRVLSDPEPVIGKLEMGNYKIAMTYSECARTIETLVQTLETYEKSYRLGSFKK
jgi:hypothetical protein